MSFDGVDDEIRFTPISTALSNVYNGAGTWAVLARVGDQGDLLGLRNAGPGATYYHTLSSQTPAVFDADDGVVLIVASAGHAFQTAGAGNYKIVVGDWQAGAASTERFHWSSLMSAAESWTHSSSSGNNGGTKAGPGTNGVFSIGNAASDGPSAAEIALVGVWSGTRFSDTDVTNLWVNKRTSDWYNHPAGVPTTLIELTSTTPIDIGSSPSTFSSIVGGAVAGGADPTGWTFDGTGATVSTELDTAAYLPYRFAGVG